MLVAAAVLPFLHLPGVAPVSASHAQAPSLLHLGRSWSLGIAALWLGCSLFRIAQLAVQGGRLRALWRQAQPIAVAPEIAALLARVPLRRVELCLSTEVDRPSVIGFFAPRILVPEWLFRQLTGPELFQIVLHEVEHLRRGDDWFNLLQKLSLALFPLNPALVWIERRLCSERELACDDGVLRVTLAPRVYASCLTTLAERRLEYRAVRRSAFSLSLGALGAFGSLGGVGACAAGVQHPESAALAEPSACPRGDGDAGGGIGRVRRRAGALAAVGSFAPAAPELAAEATSSPVAAMPQGWDYGGAESVAAPLSECRFSCCVRPPGRCRAATAYDPAQGDRARRDRGFALVGCRRRDFA